MGSAFVNGPREFPGAPCAETEAVQGPERTGRGQPSAAPLHRPARGLWACVGAGTLLQLFPEMRAVVVTLMTRLLHWRLVFQEQRSFYDLASRADFILQMLFQNVRYSCGKTKSCQVIGKHKQRS